MKKLLLSLSLLGISTTCLSMNTVGKLNHSILLKRPQFRNTEKKISELLIKELQFENLQFKNTDKEIKNLLENKKKELRIEKIKIILDNYLSELENWNKKLINSPLKSEIKEKAIQKNEESISYLQPISLKLKLIQGALESEQQIE